MIRIRGIPLTAEAAAELALLLRAQSDAGKDIAERLERARIAGMGMIATNRLEARALLAVLDERGEDERLGEIRHALSSFVGERRGSGGEPNTMTS